LAHQLGEILGHDSTEVFEIGTLQRMENPTRLHALEWRHVTACAVQAFLRYAEQKTVVADF